jgi:hypothetical protein
MIIEKYQIIECREMMKQFSDVWLSCDWHRSHLSEKNKMWKLNIEYLAILGYF